MVARCESVSAEDDRDPQSALGASPLGDASVFRPEWYTADGELTAGAQFGLRVRELRKQSGLTQEAVDTDLYMSQSYLRKIEHGDANPSINMAARLLAYLEAASHPQGQEAVTS